MKAFVTLIWILVTLLILGAVGQMDFEDESAATVRRQAAYCQRVHDRLWPDYDHNYAMICDEDGNLKPDKAPR